MLAAGHACAVMGTAKLGSRADKQGPDRAATESFKYWSWQAAARNSVFALALQLNL